MPEPDPRSGGRRPAVSSLPGLTVLRGYRRAWLRGDLSAGGTAAVYLVP
ncbi:hypothetical protein KNE206_66760 [Kitasatospora sp. NE20-6]